MTQPPDPGQPEQHDQPDPPDHEDTAPLPPPPPQWAPPGSESPHGDPLTDHQSAGYQQPYQQPGYDQAYGQGYQQPAYQPPYPQGYYNPAAPYGIHPPTGLPYSDKSKIVAGLLQVLLPFGIGRMYMGFTGIGVAQLLVTVLTCGLGALWPFIDGIMILVSDSKDAQGRILKS